MEDIACIEMGVTPKGKILYMAKILKPGETKGAYLDKQHYSIEEAEKAIRERNLQTLISFQHTNLENSKNNTRDLSISFRSLFF